MTRALRKWRNLGDGLPEKLKGKVRREEGEGGEGGMVTNVVAQDLPPLDGM